MKLRRTVPRTQRPEFIAGSKKTGSYTYQVSGYEYRPASSETFRFTGTAPTRDDAEKAAWAAARAWLRELGEFTRTDSALVIEVETP